MREVVLGSSEEDFIRSLSHSSPWQARGGKSGAAFYATEGNSVYSLVQTLAVLCLEMVYDTLEVGIIYSPLANKVL